MLLKEQVTSVDTATFLHKLKQLDFGPLAHTLMRYGWSYAQISHAIARYTLFLLLMHLYPNANLVPTWEIDQVWHHHILDTSKYMADCHTLFGRYMHHFPHAGERDERDRQQLLLSFDQTQHLFEHHFGMALADNGPFDAGESVEIALSQGATGCHLKQPGTTRRPRINVDLQLPMIL